MDVIVEQTTFLCILLGYVSLFFIGSAITGRKMSCENLFFPTGLIFVVAFFQFLLQKDLFFAGTYGSICYLLTSSVLPAVIFFFMLFANEKIASSFDTMFVLFACTYSVLMFPEILVYLILGQTVSELLSGIVTLGTAVLFWMGFKKYHLMKYVKYNDRWMRASAMCVFCLLSFLGCLCHMPYFISVNNRYLVLICMGFCALVMATHIHYNYIIYTKTAQLDVFHKYMPIVDGLIKDIREKQHSYNNALQAISMLPATYTDYKSVAEALQKYTNQYSVNNRYSDLIKLNLKLVAGFIISKCESARDENKAISYHLQTLTISTVLPEYILVEAMGILIDNALEASPSGEEVELELDEVNGHFYMKVKNIGKIISSEDRRNIFKHGFTTKCIKNESHGMGLSRLQSIVDEYGGEITLYNEQKEDKTFIVFELEV